MNFAAFRPEPVTLSIGIVNDSLPISNTQYLLLINNQYTAALSIAIVDDALPISNTQSPQQSIHFIL